MKYHKPHRVTDAEAAKVMRQTFDEMALFILTLRAEPMTQEQAREKIKAFYPRMHWLYYESVLNPMGPWKPTYYGLPENEPMLKPKGTTP